MAAANLTQATELTYEKLAVLWTANTIAVKLQAFIVAAAPFFEDSIPNDRPVGNWLVPMTALSTQITATLGNPKPLEQLNDAVDYVYRMCWAGAIAQSQSRISNTKAAGLLAAWNTNFF